MALTRWPDASRADAVWRPMKPLPPSISTFTGMSQRLSAKRTIGSISGASTTTQSRPRIFAR